MKLPKHMQDKIVEEFGIRNLTIAGGCGITGGLMIFMMMLLALDAKGGSHE